MIPGESKGSMEEILEEIVPLEEAEEHPETLQVFRALEFPVKHGSKVMKYLSLHFSSLADQGFPHLKRMKKCPERNGFLLALICPKNTNKNAWNDSKLFQVLLDEFEGEICVVEVLKYAPKTRELWETYTRDWPLIYHASVLPEAQLEQILHEELVYIEKFLQNALELASKQVKNTIFQQPEWACCSKGCIIIDPKDQLEVADSYDEKFKDHPLFHPIMIAIEGVAARDRRRNEAITSPPHKISKLNADQMHHEASSGKQQSYLCTGYDIYLDQEPCVMCAMAMVHSRVRRVFYSKTNPSDGVLETYQRLHTIKSLNHRYRVFRWKGKFGTVQK
jgi:tRNA-specific adenosine deaminase 3